MEINEDIQMESATFMPAGAVEDTVNITVCPTTGGQFSVETSPKHTVENLKKKVGRHLKIPHERLKLLFKERILETGNVSDYNIQDGCKLTLVPAVESGFSSTIQGTQQSIIQAIEGLSDVQIDDFLSGRSPLTLALRVGEHMMFVQLQLEQSVATSLPSISNSTSSSMSSIHRQQILDHMSLLQHQYSSATSSRSSSLHSSVQKSTSASGISTSAAEILQTSSRRKGIDLSNSASRKCTLASTSPHAPLEKMNHLNKLASTCSSLPNPSSGKSSTVYSSSQSSSFSKTSDHKNVEANSLYRRPTTTCGKITSGVGSLSSHGSSGQGAKVVRQMQRLRRLCGAHQQCVAYSSRELASEISSIVHAAKHSSSDSSSNSSYQHRRNGKTLRDRARGATCPLTSGAGTSNPPVAGASIDSVTTHGPGIFSGTFSGSLHPNIQDKEGRPKRDPQTILQILTDLLSATNHYEGKTGNVGMLPQLFKEHFNKQSSNLPSSSATPSAQQAPQESTTSAPRSERRRKQTQQQPHFPQPCDRGFLFVPNTQGGVYAPPFQHLLDATRGTPLFTPEAFLRPASSRCSIFQYGSATYWNSRGRRTSEKRDVHKMQQQRQENMTTRGKVQRLRQLMQMRRMRRLYRRQACNPYNKPAGSNSSNGNDGIVKRSASTDSRLNGDTSTNLDVQIDDISQFADDRKAEVGHEPMETVTV